MKRLLLIAVLMALAGEAWCSPYFRPINPAHPQPVAGGLIDPFVLKDSALTSLLPLVTHSPKDGCLLPSIVCEDWSPVAAGLSVNAGKITFDAGPLFNVLPWMQNLGKIVIPSGWTGLRSVIDYDSTGDPITFSAGPMWEYQQRTNKGFFKVFTGLALHF